jgi:glycosyltransferase involved in cell wall biosynthesis
LDAIRSSGGVVVSTSRGDSFGMTVAEGMARACAVVVPSKGPFQEFVKPEVHGLHYRLGTPNDGAKQIIKLLQDDQFRVACGMRGRSDILQRHAPDQALRVLVRELQNLKG